MNVRKELEKKGCIYKGHFVGVSGKHLSGYCNIDPLLPHISLLNKVTKLLIEPFAADDVETVVAPAVGAIPLTQWGPYHLEKLTKRTVYGVWADKVQPKSFEFERSGFIDVVKDKKILVLEDMINQMFSIKEIIKVVQAAGGEVVGVGSIAANKGVSAQSMGVPKFIALADVHYDAWSSEDCSRVGLCSQNVPIITDVGHGNEYQIEHPDYDGGYTEILTAN